MPLTTHGIAGLLAVVVLLPLPAEAQERPDFSGRWTVSAQGGRGGRGAEPDLGSGWGPSFTIVQREDTLIVERNFFSRGDLQPPLKFRYSLGGGETAATVLMGRGAQEQTSSASWDGATLTIVTRHHDDRADGGRGVTSEVRHRLSLQPASREAHPPSLVIETTRIGVMGGASFTTRSSYAKN